MGRPVKPRTAATFERDLQTLAHLRTAILLDRTLDRSETRRAVDLIDQLTELCLNFSQAKDSEESEPDSESRLKSG